MINKEGKEDVDHELVKAIEDAIAESERIRSLPYDGVVGLVSDEFDPLDKEFYAVRNELLHKYTEKPESEDVNAHQTILRFIQHYEETSKPGMHIRDVQLGCKRPHYIPVEVEDRIAFLCKMKRAVNLGVLEGMRLLAGDYAAAGISSKHGSSKGGKGKKDSRGAARKVVERICDDIKDSELDLCHVLECMDEDEYMNDLFESTAENRIDIQVQAVDSEKKEVRYRKRNGDSKSIKFSTIGNYISAYKKNSKK